MILRISKAIGKYLSRLAAVWIIGLFLLLLDVAGGVEKLVPGFELPWWVYFGIFSLSFVVANAYLFVSQELEKQLLKDHIAELEALEADIRLGVQGEPELGVAEHSIDERGLPHQGAVQVILEFENVGYKPGEPVLELDRTESRLPFPFEIDPEGSWGFNMPLHTVDGQERTQRYLIVPLRVTAQQPSRFARALNTPKPYSIVIRYHTKRIGGISGQRKLVIQGDYHKARKYTKAYFAVREFFRRG
jgi:hypothetical protein